MDGLNPPEKMAVKTEREREREREREAGFTIPKFPKADFYRASIYSSE